MILPSFSCWSYKENGDFSSVLFLSRNMSIKISCCSIFAARSHREHSIFKPCCCLIYHINSIKINHLLSKYPIRMDFKVTNIHQIIICKADRYCPIKKVVLMVFQFHLFVRSDSATKVAQHDCRFNCRQSFMLNEF